MSSRAFRYTVGGILVATLAGSGAPPMPTLAARSKPRTDTPARIITAFGSLPLYFTENRGQLDGRVTYYVQGRDTSIYFTSQGVTIALTNSAATSVAEHAAADGSVDPLIAAPAEQGTRRWTVKLDFVGANPEARLHGQNPTPAVVSYFKGSRAQWKAGLKTYGGVIYRDLWPGIDLTFTGTASRLKYAFLVHPGADPAQIRLAYRGATSVEVTGAGELEVSTPVGGFRDEQPYAYQDVDGQRVEVSAAYGLDPKLRDGARGYGFKLGSYDSSKLLVVDPAMLLYAGYIGGEGSDQGFGIAVDSAGNAYVTGSTLSSEATFPATVGPDLTFNVNGSVDAFVAKVNALGTALEYAGYIGGTGNEQGLGIAVDSGGNAYVAGNTSSSETTFPATVGPDLTYNLGTDAFVAKVNALGTALDYAGYIGGGINESANGIAVDSAGNAYVTGLTRSSQATFPVAVGPDLTYNGGVTGDAFVAKVNATGTALDYAGYIGGTDSDSGRGIDVDSAGNAYVIGTTLSSEASFPVTVGPDLTFNGNFDAFVAKVNALGTALDYAGYIGGTGADSGSGIAVDSAGNAYVAGGTASSEATFPVTVGPDVTYNGGIQDGFVAKVNPLGTALDYAGYIGGADNDLTRGVAVDNVGNAYVTGLTSSSEATFPATAGPDLTFNGSVDAFVARVNPSGMALNYAGYIGGTGDDFGIAIAADSVGNAYVTGFTNSSEATFPATAGPDLTFNGGDFDAFVAKIASGGGAPAVLTLEPVADTNPVGSEHCVTATVTDTGGDPVSDVNVRFAVTGSVNTSGTATSDASGEATFCYIGPPLPGSDAISAFADTDNDTTQDGDEPSGAATKVWVLPVSTPLCEITGTIGGRITAANGDQATFGGNARLYEDGTTQGEETYQDHGPAQPMRMRSVNVLAIVCDSATDASIFGQATVDGAGPFTYRIRVQDLGEPGENMDTYWLLLQTGYNSGEQVLEGGNVQIRRRQ